MLNKFPITQKGYEKLAAELKYLKSVERPAIIEAIATARELGDLSENAEYHAARERQSFVEGRILDLEDKLSRADIIHINKLSGDVVKFGATVKIIDDETEEEVTYQIVSEYEGDIASGLLSMNSPLARGLIGKKTGDYIEITTPTGVKAYEILAVKFVE